LGTLFNSESFYVYSLITVVTLLLSGFLIDKLSSRKLLPFLNVPLLLSLIVLIFFDHEYIAFIFMGLLGMTNGLINIFMSSLWAEIYGVNYLGSIKALTASLMVFSTAFATAFFGILIDFGHSIENIAILCAFYSAISILILIIYKKSYKPTILKNKT
jgi:predicted MFS family arabinose efflux permease